MTSLESVVLPFAESRALVKAGIVLDTALSYYSVDPPEDGRKLRKGEATEFIFVSGECVDPICPAPVLSEILNAIRKAADILETKIKRAAGCIRTRYQST